MSEIPETIFKGDSSLLILEYFWGFSFQRRFSIEIARIIGEPVCIYTLFGDTFRAVLA